MSSEVGTALFEGLASAWTSRLDEHRPMPVKTEANADALSQYVDISVPDRAIAMPVAEIARLQRAGKITPQTVAQWGIQDQIDKSEGKGDVVIPFRSFIKARMAPVQNITP